MPSCTVSVEPETDFTVPSSAVTVMKALPARFSVTASTWTAGPPGPWTPIPRGSPGPWPAFPDHGAEPFVAAMPVTVPPVTASPVRTAATVRVRPFI